MRRKPLIVAMSAVLTSIAGFASDVEVAPAPGGAFIIRDESMNERFKVLDSGEVYIPGISSTPLSASPLCFISPLGQVTQCNPDVLIGTQGPQGPQGDTGVTGPTGPQGLQGSQGEQGLTGTQGPAGSQGADGNDGADGALGPQGLTGAQGPTGSQGTDGNDGADGAQGPAGLTGDQGPTGSQGADGNDGADGALGPQGATGAQGQVGTDGTDGAQGAQGAEGAAGVTNLSEVLHTCTNLALAGSSATLTCQVSCPAGYVLISGGFECSFTGSSGVTPTDATCDSELYVKQSRPLSLGSGWVATWRNAGVSAISAEVITYAYCAVIDGCSVANPDACAPPDPP
jgi:hypothetical protein